MPDIKSDVLVQAALLIACAERQLWPLSRGEKIDLLLDNMPSIKSRDEGLQIVEAL